ncbi:MAG TPA: hypothetical protein VHR41_08015 [Gemmatimonadales bacterium]|jgi:hypothetical protein|nr:hypothetical protein [Gemmatimonadales bacterium]
MHPIIHWIREVEEVGYQRAITVVVAGEVISGSLCPFGRYTRWRDECDRRAGLAGGRLEIPVIEIPPLTEEERADFRGEWAVRLATARAEQGFPSDDEALRGLFDYFAVSNARLRMDKYEFLVVKTADVGAFYPGLLEEARPGKVQREQQGFYCPFTARPCPEAPKVP